MIKSRINAEYLTDVVWDLRWTLSKLNDAAGFSVSYIYRLTDKEAGVNVTLGTIDALANAMTKRFTELKKDVPVDLWCKLIVREEVPEGKVQAQDNVNTYQQMVQEPALAM